MNFQPALDRDRSGRAAHLEYPCSPSILPGVVVTLDVLSIGVAYLLSIYFAGPYITDVYHYSSALFIGIGYLLLSGRSRLNELYAIMKPMRFISDVAVAFITSLLMLLSIVFSFDASDAVSRDWVFLFAASSVTLISINRLALHGVVRQLSRRRIIGRSMVVLGAGEQSRRFLRRVARNNPYFISITGVYGDVPPEVADVEGYPVLGEIEDLISHVRRQKIDDIVIAMPWNADSQLMKTVELLKQLPVNVYLCTDLVGFELSFRPVLSDFASLPVFEIVQRPISGWSLALKNMEDFVLSIILIIALSPLLILIAALIKLDSSGPVLFTQKRLGFNNKVFHIYKFRSMYHTRVPEAEVQQATRGDPRVTRVGRIIRATSLDELPQLFNVLNGAMSIVGPRPHAVSHNQEYGQQIRGYFMRHRVKPGITGWAQINGCRGETAQLERMEERIQYDIYYADNWSIFFDLKIIIITIFIVPFQRAAY